MTLSEWLVSEDLTQEEFAQMIGKSTSTVSRLVNGKHREFKTLLKVVEVTGGAVTPSDFMEMAND